MAYLNFRIASLLGWAKHSA